MKKLVFIHNDSTQELIEVGHQLEILLANTEIDDKLLLDLIVHRDELVNVHLAKLDEKSLQTFVAAELEINNRLTTAAKGLLKTSLNEISGYLRGKKAVDKYTTSPYK